MDNQHELRLRRQAMRLRMQGIPYRVILTQVHRSSSWLSKWQKRFDQQGSAGLRSRSRQPHHTPTACSARIVRVLVQTRRRLVKQKIGLIGARMIRRELRSVLGKQTPSVSTIQRVLRTQGLVTATAEKLRAYFPKPLTALTGTLQALDWTCRYLEGGAKGYAFHTVNLRTRACAQTIATDKRTETVIQHGGRTWPTLGIPQFLQLDNAAAFCGGYKAPRLFGHFVRLCLYVGLELIFLPIAEPECNGEVEELNGLWAQAFWERRRFTSGGPVRQASPAFLRWYMTTYAPPFLAERTPAQAPRREPKRRLTGNQIARVPETLPITAGRVHFIRRVKPDGTIPILNETWPVSQRLAGKSVWATVITHCHRLEIGYQQSAHPPWHLRKIYAYDLPETVARLKPEFAHPKMA